MKNLPKRIYLQIDADGETPEDFKDLSGVSWCADKINDNDIAYVLESDDSEAVEFAEWIQRNSWLEGKESGVWYKWHGMECDEGNPKTTKELYQIFKSQV
jgi:hypothetical protein